MPHRGGVAIAVSPEQAVETAERVLALALRSVDDAEVFYVASSSVPARFEANAVKGVDANDSAGAALRVIKDGRVGFGSSSDLANPQALVDAALETAPFGAEARFEFPPALPCPDVRPYDPSAGETTLEEMVALGERAVAEIRAYSSDVQVEGGVGKSDSTIAVLNSKGGGAAHRRSRFQIGFQGTVIRGEDMLFTSESKSGVAALGDPSPVVASILRQLEWAKETAAAETKTMPVILMPTAIRSIILGPLLAGLSGRSVLRETSPLVGRLGERVVDERFTLVHDPTAPGAANARPLDDEGVPSRRLPLIERGAVSAFFYDLQTAGQAGAETTSCGERGLGSLPEPGVSVLLVEEGEASLDDLIVGMDEGLIVERLLGAGQGNLLGGDFNANVLLGYKVERGRVAGRVKNTMVSGNAYRALSDLIAVGGEGRWVGGGLHAPPIAVGGVSVASKE